MTAPTRKDEKDTDLESEMKKYGIRRVTIDQFHVGGFRYTDLSHAIAQAKRFSANKNAG